MAIAIEKIKHRLLAEAFVTLMGRANFSADRIVSLESELSMIIDLIKLNARTILIRKHFDYISSARYQFLINEIGNKNRYFDFEGAASCQAVGWVSTRKGSLIANLLFSTTRVIYPKFDFDKDNVTAKMLINVTIAFNKRYCDKLGAIDVNQVNSMFCGIARNEVIPSKCSCSRFFLRTIQSSTSQCPWCRIGVVAPSTKKIKFNKSRTSNISNHKDRAVGGFYIAANSENIKELKLFGDKDASKQKAPNVADGALNEVRQEQQLALAGF